MEEYRVLLFYKYVDVENPEEFMTEHLTWCMDNDIKGRVFVAHEGINGTVSGKLQNINKYKAHLNSFPMFRDIIFKEDKSDEHAFLKCMFA